VNSIAPGRRLGLVLVGGLAALASGLLVSLTWGSAALPMGAVWRALGTPGDIAHTIVCDLRLPRALVAAAVGANLALAGTVLQGITRNPLAAPGIIGVNAGAGLAALLAMIVFPQYSLLVPPLAFAGGAITALVVFALAWEGGGAGSGPVRLILAGVAMASLLGAATSTIMVVHSELVQGVVAWLVGGLSGRSWPHWLLIWPYTLGGLTLTLLWAPQLNLLALGDEVAQNLGLNCGLARLWFVVLAAVLAGSAISVAGLVGFVGLIVPHIARLITGADHRLLLPAAALFGGALVVWADFAARMLLAPVELPVGILLAALGAPFFIYLLRRRLRQ